MWVRLVESQYMGDYLADAYYDNLLKSREGLYYHAGLPPCKHLYKPRTREYYLCRCIKKAGGQQGVNRIIGMYMAGAPIKHITEETGVPHMCIYLLVGEHIRRRRRRTPRPALNKEEQRLILFLYENGYTIKEIQEILGLRTPQTIYNILERHGIKLRRGHYRTHTRITPELRETVLRLRSQGLSIPEIARRTGLSVGSVHNIIKKALKA